MEEKKELRLNYSFTSLPSVVKKAKENAWKDRKAFSEIIESLLIKYNKSKEKAKQVA